MLDIELILNSPAQVKAGLARKKFARPEVVEALVDEAAALQIRRRALIAEVETHKARKNQLSKEFGQRKRTGQPIGDLTAAIAAADAGIPAGEKEITGLDAQLREIMLGLPNLPDEDAPEGDETANREISRHGEPRCFDFPVRAHEEIGEALGILDFTRAAKLSGARFVVLKGAGALLERALVNFMLDLHTREHGYIEVFPPLLVKRDTPFATGHLPKSGDQMFVAFKGSDLDGVKEPPEFTAHSEKTPYFLVPTAELPLTGMHADEIFDAAALPVKYVAFTPCFRSEAGSYGKDVRGMLRQHQFQKVELYQITAPEHSQAAHEELTGHAEKVLQRLGLPYRKMLLAAGDMGFSARRTYDLEVWVPSQKLFREISSCSNCGDFQARRAKIRCRDENKKNRLAHTLNGSGLAVGRTALAILENYQQADGTVEVPQALRPYMGGLEKIGT